MENNINTQNKKRKTTIGLKETQNTQAYNKHTKGNNNSNRTMEKQTEKTSNKETQTTKNNTKQKQIAIVVNRKQQVTKAHKINKQS